MGYRTNCRRERFTFTSAQPRLPDTVLRKIYRDNSAVEFSIEFSDFITSSANNVFDDYRRSIARCSLFGLLSLFSSLFLSFSFSLFLFSLPHSSFFSLCTRSVAICEITLMLIDNHSTSAFSREKSCNILEKKRGIDAQRKREKERGRRKEEGRKRITYVFHKLSTVTRSVFSVVNESPVGRMLTRC